MDNLFTALDLNGDTIFFFTLLSLLTFIISLVVLPVLILAIPEDYFADKKRHPLPWFNSRLLQLSILLIKNLLGILMIFVGLLLLVLPGQGILTLLAGLVLMDFPGKFRLLRWLAHKEKVLLSLNWIRKKGGKEPFTR